MGDAQGLWEAEWAMAVGNSACTGMEVGSSDAAGTWLDLGGAWLDLGRT